MDTEDDSNVILTWYVVFSFRDLAFLFKWIDIDVLKNHGDLLCCQAEEGAVLGGELLA